MGSKCRRSILTDRIAAALNERNIDDNRCILGSRRLACAGIALLAMQSGPATAVGLGDLRLQSGLGQPLRATVPVTIGAGEATRANCVRPTDSPRGGLGGVPDPSVSVPKADSPGTYNIRIETASPLYEPMYELSLMVDCPGTALLVRHYVLMLDLPGMPAVPAASAEVATGDPGSETQSPRDGASPAVVSSSRQLTGETRPAPRPRPVVRRDRSPIPADSTYRVQSGDTLSTIAERIEGRPPNAIWDVAMQIFARNPDAFIRANPDMIRRGETISIPSVAQMQLAAGLSVEMDDQPAPPRAPTPAPSVAAERDAVVRQDTVAPATRPTPATEVFDAPQPIPTESLAEPEPSTESSPFADELLAAEEAAGATETTPAETVPAEIARPEIDTVVTVGSETDADDEVNPFIAIVLGLLLGLVLSVLIARSKLIDLIGGLLRRRQPAPRKAAATPIVDTFNEFDASVSDFQGATMNDFDDKAADAAFATDPGFDPESTPVQLGTRAEDTYIVEVSEAEQTLQDEEKSDDELYAPTTGIPTEDPLGEDSLANIDRENLDLLIDDENAPDAFSGVNEDTVLSQLFDEEFDPAAVAEPEATGAMPGEQLEPTADMPRGNLEPTAEMPAGNLEPTAEMPAGNLDPTTEMPAADLDPTAELPADFVDPAEVIDPTAEPTAAEREEQMSMTQSFSENLERLDTGGATPAEKELASIDSTTSTLQMPSKDRDAMSTAELNLEELVKGAADDESLSQTLHEALSLLERDYEDEFTASQILERREIEKALREEEEDDTVAARKVK